MARTLTKKQRGFVNDYADSGNGTQSALKHYDTKDVDVAAVIAVENLGKPKIVAALKELGFDADNAKRVVGEILNDASAGKGDRLRAADMVFSVDGTYAATKTQAVNVNIEAQIQDKTAIDALREEFEAKLKANFTTDETVGN